MSVILSRANLSYITSTDIAKPDNKLLDLPVKVLQFGTGVLLRGLPDYLIDKANRQGIFNGRIVVVKSTSAGDIDLFKAQDNLYTLLVKGIENGHKVEENIICSAISKVLSAVDDWDMVLQQAANPELKVVISNTTEVGIRLVKESIDQAPPVSFPAKLLAVLYHRYKVLGNKADNGLVIIPTELLTDNGDALKAIIIELIKFNQLGADFEQWINRSNYFCNSLVDRIVPGKPAKADQAEFEASVNYHDELLAVSEVYCLWAIKGDEKIRSILSFEQADEGVVITPDIDLYRELKLRLLNGTHTMSCALAFLSGFDTVKAAMDDETFLDFIHQLMAEIATAIPYPVDAKQAKDFAAKVLDRFRNPYIRHLWISISQQYTTKLKMRIVPVLEQYYKLYNHVPLQLARGFAAYIYFMRSVKLKDGVYYGHYRQADYPVNDDKAVVFYNIWKDTVPAKIAATVLKDPELWGTDLSVLPGFTQSVQNYLDNMLSGNIS